MQHHRSYICILHFITGTIRQTYFKKISNKKTTNNNTFLSFDLYNFGQILTKMSIRDYVLAIRWWRKSVTEGRQKEERYNNKKVEEDEDDGDDNGRRQWQKKNHARTHTRHTFEIDRWWKLLGGVISLISAFMVNTCIWLISYTLDCVRACVVHFFLSNTRSLAHYIHSLL